ncbi:hypothetical protein Phou_061250 [Phytohabitans houttuyneae]|uniref:Uncharacterized protein n=1 Tax=Phytohabitans houttuyneae TaxID=1076126 RepID=A0A6V8KMS8_9ACTN|nr:hypothetical protein Phou_061250 [Phytohabitans houttuyneae]
MPSRNTTGSSTSASVAVWVPKPVASASKASAMIEADSTVRKTVARLWASLQISDRAESKLQRTSYVPTRWPTAATSFSYAP